MFLPASLRFPIVKIIEITYKVKQRTSDILRVKWLFILYTGDTVKIWTSLSSCFSEITNGLVNRIADPSLHSSYSFCNYYTRLYSYLWFLTILNESWLFPNFLHCRNLSMIICPVAARRVLFLALCDSKSQDFPNSEMFKGYFVNKNPCINLLMLYFPVFQG